MRSSKVRKLRKIVKKKERKKKLEADGLDEKLESES